MWPQTNKSSSHQNLTWEQSLDPCQQNYRPRHWWFILFKICLQIALWKGYSSNLGSCLAPGSSSENSWYITQSFPRGMSEMCVKYPTFKTQKQITTSPPYFLVIQWLISLVLVVKEARKPSVLEGRMLEMMKFDNVWYELCRPARQAPCTSTCWNRFNEGWDRSDSDEICITMAGTREDWLFYNKTSTFSTQWRCCILSTSVISWSKWWVSG